MKITKIGHCCLVVEVARNYLAKINPAEVTGVKERKILLPWMAGKYSEAETFLDELLFMNNLFHLTTTYNILRNNSVVLGKMDYLGQIEMKG